MANIEHSANFFLQLSSFTRHLLDNILPVEVYNKPNVSSDIVENLIKECDALIGSLQNFKTKTSALQVNEAASLLDGLDIKDNVQFNKLCESLIENIVTISDIIKYKPFYCNICNLTTKDEKVFNEHCFSLKHIEQINQKLEPLTAFKCQLCYMVLIAPESKINSIKLLSSHCKLDDHIKRIKENNEKRQPLSKTFSNSTKSLNAEMNVSQIPVKNKKNIVQNTTNSQNNLPETNRNAAKSIMPPKVKTALKLIRKRLRIDRRLPDTNLHYCNICDVAVYSTPSYIQHNSSKQHISAVSSAINSIHLFKCDKCKILITGHPAVIDEIITSDLHKEIDEWMKTLKTVPPKKQETTTIKTTQSALNSTAKTDVPLQTPKEMPTLLKESLTFIYEKLTTVNDLKKYSPCYCFVCERRIDSINNFQQHMKAKQHNLLCSAITEPLRFYQCTICFIGLFGIENEVSNAIKSKEHINLNQKINNTFKNIKINVENSVTDGKVLKEKGDVPSVKVPKVSTKPDVKPTSNLPQPAINNIPTKFFTFNAKLLSGCFIKSGFCRLCNKGVLIKNGWAVHLNCKKHIAKSLETEAKKNLLPSRCKFCPFQILGDQQYGNVCMNAHLKLNHPDVEGIEIKNGSDITTDLNQTSVISSQQYVNSNIKDGSDNFIPNELQGTNDITVVPSDSSAQSTNIDEESKIQYSSSEKINISSGERNILNLNIFIKFLKKKKNRFLNDGLKQFGGICLICSMVFEDYYVWLIHVKGTTHRDMNQSHNCERECEKCNLSLFGERSVIDNDLWSLEEHLSLDTLMQ